MKGDILLELWINQYKHDALNSVLEQQGSSIQAEMQAHLTSLYTEHVPAQAQEEICQRIDAEALVAQAQYEANRRFSAFRITENEETVCVECETAFNAPQTALRVRRYLRGELGKGIASLSDSFLKEGAPITSSDFDELAKQRIEKNHNITGVFDIDLDKKEFANADPNMGWTSYALEDITAAAFYAYRKEFRSAEMVWNIFYGKLEGKELGMTQTQGQQM